MTRSEQLGQRVAGQLVEGGSRAGPKAGPTYLHCCAGPSIGRAGRPHRPPCSPQWHLSREGAVSQDPPRSPQPAPRRRLPAQGRTGSLALPRLPDTDSGHTASLFPSSLSSFHRSRLQPQLRAKEATQRQEGEGKALGFCSEGPRPPGPADWASLAKGGSAEPAEAVDAPSRRWVSSDRLRPAFCHGVCLPTLKQPDGGGNDSNNESNARETLPRQVALPSPRKPRAPHPLTPNFESSVGHSAFLRVSRK